MSDEEVSDGDLEEELSAEKTGGDNAGEIFIYYFFINFF